MHTTEACNQLKHAINIASGKAKVTRRGGHQRGNGDHLVSKMLDTMKKNSDRMARVSERNDERWAALFRRLMNQSGVSTNESETAQETFERMERMLDENDRRCGKGDGVGERAG